MTVCVCDPVITKCDISHNLGTFPLQMQCQKTLDDKLHDAIVYGRPHRVKDLLEQKANPNYERQPKWQQGLHLCAILSSIHFGHEQASIMELLLKHGANVNRTNHTGQTALFCTSAPQIATILVDSGADVTFQDLNGRTAEDYARLIGATEFQDWLQRSSKLQKTLDN